MIPTWPAIPYLAERGSWGLALSDGRSRTSSDMDSGQTRTRRRFTRTGSPTSFSFRFTSAELALFKYFYAEVLADGALWFYMPIYDGERYAVNLVRFDPQSSPAVTEIGFDAHEVSASLQIRELSKLSKDAFEFFSAFGYADGARVSDVVYDFVNNKYPEIVGA